MYDKIAEELQELRAASGRDAQTSELGDVLFSVVNLARHLGVDPEIALARANDTFVARFQSMEALARERRLELRSMDLADLDALWDEAKSQASTVESPPVPGVDESVG